MIKIFSLNQVIEGLFKLTSFATTEIYDGPKVTKPHYFYFSKIFDRQTDQPTKNTTYKNTSCRLKTFSLLVILYNEAIHSL